MSGRLDLVDMTEIARMLDMKIGTVRMWRLRGKLPPAASELTVGPIWQRKTIEEWAANMAAQSRS